MRRIERLDDNIIHARFNALSRMIPPAVSPTMEMSFRTSPFANPLLPKPVSPGHMDVEEHDKWTMGLELILGLVHIVRCHHVIPPIRNHTLGHKNVELVVIHNKHRRIGQHEGRVRFCLVRGLIERAACFKRQLNFKCGASTQFALDTNRPAMQITQLFGDG